MDETGIFKSWEQYQKQTRGFKKADYKSFDTKKEAGEWLMTQPRDKENHDEANGHNEKELQYPEELETTHRKTECKHGGDDEKSDTKIECCLCKRLYHVQCIGLTENEGEDKSVENLENENEKTTEEDETTTNEVCSGEENQNGGEERDEETEDGETETDEHEQGEKEKDHEKESEASGPNTERVETMNMKIWICENCSVIPKKTDKILKNLMDHSRS